MVRAVALHIADTDLIPGTPYVPSSSPEVIADYRGKRKASVLLGLAPKSTPNPQKKKNPRISYLAFFKKTLKQRLDSKYFIGGGDHSKKY